MHISDLHLQSGPPWRFNANALERLAWFTTTLRRKPDAILVTGDLANTGGPGSLKFAHRFISQLGIQRDWARPKAGSHPTVEQRSSKVVLLPGNHDRYHKFTLGKPGCDRFDEIFASYWKAGLGGVQLHTIDGDKNTVLAVICADFSLAQRSDAIGAKGHWGQGRVYADRLEALREATTTAREQSPAVAVVWAVHFSPEIEVDDHEPSADLRLLDEDRLVAEADSLGVRHVFCGHMHWPRRHVAKSSANVLVHRAGSATARSLVSPMSIHIVVFQVEAGTIHGYRALDYAWEKREQTYKPLKTE